MNQWLFIIYVPLKDYVTKIKQYYCNITLFASAFIHLDTHKYNYTFYESYNQFI